METPLDIFRHVVTTTGTLLRDERFNDVQILREIDSTVLLGTISKVSVPNERDSHLQ